MTGAKVSHRRHRFVGPIFVLIVGACCLIVLFLYTESQDQRPEIKPTSALDRQKQRGVHTTLGTSQQAVRAFQTAQLKSNSVAATPWTCPQLYKRLSYEEVKNRVYKPYVLGGAQQPNCTNCHKTGELWSEFCQFKSHGPTCRQWDQWRLLDSFIQRAEQGAEGFKSLLTMTPCDFFELLEGRTLWLLGDSLTQELHRATQCFFYEFWNLEVFDPRNLTSDKEAQEALSNYPSGWCVNLLRNTTICHVRANYGEHLTRYIFPNLSKLGAVASDIILFNFGVWHNDVATFSGNTSVVEAYLRQHKSEMPFLVWRLAAPQHFDTPLGEFGCEGCPTPQGPYKCQEVDGVTLNAKGELEAKNASTQILAEGGWRNKITIPTMKRLGIPVLHIWNETMPYWDYHYNFQKKDDCTHFCHPSVYQLWLYQFYQLLQDLRDQLPARLPRPPLPKQRVGAT